MRQLTLASLVFALSVAGCKCNEPVTPPDTTGEISLIYSIDGVEVIRPSADYQFKGVPMGTSRHLKLTVRNTGRGPLDLASLEKTSGAPLKIGDTVNEADPVFTFEFTPVTLSASETQDFDIEFDAPTSADMLQHDYAAKLVLHATNTAPGLETAAIDVSGSAVYTECSLPTKLDFGGVTVNQTVSRTVQLKNVTAIDTTGSVGNPMSSSGDNFAFGFGAGSATGMVNLPSGVTKDVIVTFTPSQTQGYSAFLKMRAADHCPEVTVQLVGTGVTSAVACKTSPLDFGYLPPGLTTKKTQTLLNYSLDPVTVSAMAAAPATNYAMPAGPLSVPAATRVVGTNGALVLTPGEATVEITFQPTVLGPLAADFTASTSLTTQARIACPLTGVGGGPDIAIKPMGTMDLGAVPYFAPPNAAFFVTRKITIQNVGNQVMPPNPAANLHLGIGGQPPTYFRVTPKNAATTVAELCVGELNGTTCTNAPSSAYDPALGVEATAGRGLLDVPIRVTPDGPNKSLEWDVEIFSNDPDQPVVTLNVKAHSVALPPCNYAVSPGSVAFGLVTPPSTRDLSFTITNLGTVATDTCLITSLDLAPGSESSFSLPNGPLDQVTLPAGGTKVVTVRVTGTGNAGTVTRVVNGIVRFGISSPTAPQRDVPVSAAIALACLTISPDDLDFGTVKRGCDSASRTFTVYNTCLMPVTINGWRMSAPAGQPAGGPNCPTSTACPEFMLDGPPGFTVGQQIASGASMPLTFKLKYHPIDLGPDRGAFLLDITQNNQQIDQLVTLKGNGDAVGRNTDTFAQNQRPKADVLWVIDSSCSMRDKQTLLSQNFSAFITYATTGVPSGIDYQMGVIDSDPDPATAGHLIGDAVNPKVLKAGMTGVEQMFRAKVQVGTSGGGDEHFADQAVKALSAPLVNNDNAGFLRADAVLAVIAVTDAGDQSLLPTSVLIGLLANIKGQQRPGMFTYNVIGPFSTSPPPGCNYDDYTDLVVHNALLATFNGVSAQICEANGLWATRLEGIGRTAFGYRDRFFLNSTPDMAALPVFTVMLDTTPVPEFDMSGNAVWTYEQASNSIHFNAAFVPEPGQALTVTYTALCQ